MDRIRSENLDDLNGVRLRYWRRKAKSWLWPVGTITQPSSRSFATPGGGKIIFTGTTVIPPEPGTCALPAWTADPPLG